MLELTRGVVEGRLGIGDRHLALRALLHLETLMRGVFFGFGGGGWCQSRRRRVDRESAFSKETFFFIFSFGAPLVDARLFVHTGHGELAMGARTFMQHVRHGRSGES